MNHVVYVLFRLSQLKSKAHDTHSAASFWKRQPSLLCFHAKSLAEAAFKHIRWGNAFWWYRIFSDYFWCPTHWKWVSGYLRSYLMVSDDTISLVQSLGPQSLWSDVEKKTPSPGISGAKIKPLAWSFLWCIHPNFWGGISHFFVSSMPRKELHWWLGLSK